MDDDSEDWSLGVPFAFAEDGVRLYFEVSGAGEPLLLIAGRASDHHLWNLIRGDFRRYRVIVYDQRGTGQSDKPEQPAYSTRGFAQDAVAILDQLGLPRAHVYGASMGGAIGQWLGIDMGTGSERSCWLAALQAIHTAYAHLQRSVRSSPNPIPR